jgi:hypothetical protein
MRRFRDQGMRTTLVWFYGRSMPIITGRPMMRFSRITPEIYIGPQYRSRGLRSLEREGILYCINMRIEYDSSKYGLIPKGYCYLPTIDDTAPTMEHLEEGVAFIQKAVSEGGKVYIHCAGGIGRAPTMAVAYFITQGNTVEEAIGMIKKIRPFINITPIQMERLKEFEARHLAKQPE